VRTEVKLMFAVVPVVAPKVNVRAPWIAVPEMVSGEFITVALPVTATDP